MNSNDPFDVRCPNCGKLLFKAEAAGGSLTIQCARCKTLVRWPSRKGDAISEPRSKGEQVQQTTRLVSETERVNRLSDE